MINHPSMHWGAEALWEQLEPLLPGLSVEVVPRSPSTNTTLIERARTERDGPDDRSPARVRRSVESAAFGRRAIDMQPCLLVAEHQFAGRGRQGREWESMAGASLTFSLALPLTPSDWSGLSLAVGVALCEALAASPGAPRIGLKWPNDLWVIDEISDEISDEVSNAVSATANSGPSTGPAPEPAVPGATLAARKLGGILIETVSSDAKRLAVIGVGLNIAPLKVDDTSSGFACLTEFDPGATAPATLHRVALPLARALKQFEAEGFAAFAERFAAVDILRGHAVRTTHADAPQGIADGVAPDGALLVRTADAVRAVSSGEVSVRLATLPPGHAVTRPTPL